MGFNHGLIIDVEGIDGSGKGTQTKRMAEYLESRGYHSYVQSYPKYNDFFGKMIAKYLQGGYGSIEQVPHELICLAYAQDRQQDNDQVFNSIDRGTTVIMDRYTYSNLFTAAKLPRDQWEPFIKWIEEMEFSEMGIYEPNYGFYLHVDPEISIQRILERGKRDYQEGKEDIHENNFELLRNTAACYLDFAQKKDNWFVIDQMKDGKQLSPDEVFELIKEKLDYIIEQKDEQVKYQKLLKERGLLHGTDKV